MAKQPINFDAFTKRPTDEIIVHRYETDAMHAMRQRLQVVGFRDDDIDTFKACLIALENQGLRLEGKLK